MLTCYRFSLYKGTTSMCWEVYWSTASHISPCPLIFSLLSVPHAVASAITRVAIHWCWTLHITLYAQVVTTNTNVTGTILGFLILFRNTIDFGTLCMLETLIHVLCSISFDKKKKIIRNIHVYREEKVSRKYSWLLWWINSLATGICGWNFFIC